MPLFKKKDKMSSYARIFPAKIQNRLLMEAISRISGPKLVDYLKNIDTKEARLFFNKYPDIKARLNNPLKNKIYPSLLKKAAILTPIFWFGLLPKHEQEKYMQRIKDNLPWNKKKTQHIKPKTELKSSGLKQVRFDVGHQKVLSSAESETQYEYKGIKITASCKEEAAEIFACIEDISASMQEYLENYNILSELDLDSTEEQEMIVLNSLCNLSGKKLDKVFAEIDIDKLRELIDKYPEYKNKLPSKLLRLCDNSLLVPER